MDQQKVPSSTVFTPDYFRERVKRGIQLLDEKGPEDWRDCIKLTILNLANGCDCILGQIYGNYNLAIGKLGIEADGKRFDLGFSVKTVYDHIVLDYKARSNAWAALTQCWKEELSKQ